MVEKRVIWEKEDGFSSAALDAVCGIPVGLV
jgi:hypothetical protein